MTIQTAYLNSDQKQALKSIKSWWISPNKCFILEGRAGTGKTFMIPFIAKELKACKVLITAPTNEAVTQVRKNLTDSSLVCKTIYSALGFRFDTSKESKKLKQFKVPQELYNYNLIILDECSMIGDANEVFKAILDTGIKILFLGHRAQLPEVRKSIATFDPCESIVFNQNFPIYTLNTPVRHTHKIYDFCVELEKLITSKRRIIPNDFNLSKVVLNKIIVENNKEFSSGRSTVICWSNVQAHSYNTRIRASIFGKGCSKFEKDDRIVITRPTNYVGILENISEKRVTSLRHKSINIPTNTKFKVVEVEEVLLFGELKASRLRVAFMNKYIYIYVPEIENIYESSFYKDKLREVYSIKTAKARMNGFSRLHFFFSIFSQVKYTYAITAHRSQGMSLTSVYVDLENMNKCSNPFLKHKLIYVAASRAMKELNMVK